MASSFLPNIKWLKAKIYKCIKDRSTSDVKLRYQDLELFLTEAFGFRNTGDENYFADGVKDDVQISVKTRLVNPTKNKVKKNSDFQTDPEKFLGPKYVKKHDYYFNGVEITQRRQALPFDDIKATPDEVGNETLNKFKENVNDSYKRFNTSTSYEIIATHGYSIDKKYYNVSVFWKEFKDINSDGIKWERKFEGDRVIGYKEEDNKKIRIYDRINGNAARQSTCFIEYKNLLTYNDKIEFKIPIKDVNFNFESEYAEMEALEKKYESGV